MPSHVEQCDKGEQCCWRWLAHAVLKEATWLKEDLDTTREEHDRYARERQKAEHDSEAYAELRGAHAETQRELAEVRVETHEMRREMASLKTAHAHKVAHEQELERELAKSERERRQTSERETAALKRSQIDEKEALLARHTAEDLQAKLLAAEDEKARLRSNFEAVKRERDALQQVVDLATAKAKKKDKGGGKKNKGTVAAGSGRQAVRGRSAPK